VVLIFTGLDSSIAYSPKGNLRLVSVSFPHGGQIPIPIIICEALYGRGEITILDLGIDDLCRHFFMGPIERTGFLGHDWISNRINAG